MFGTFTGGRHNGVDTSKKMMELSNRSVYNDLNTVKENSRVNQKRRRTEYSYSKPA